VTRTERFEVKKTRFSEKKKTTQCETKQTGGRSKKRQVQATAFEQTAGGGKGKNQNCLMIKRRSAQNPGVGETG